MPKAYWVSTYLEIHDPEKFGDYLALAGPAIVSSGGKFIARGPAAKVYEAGVLQRTTIIEFSSLESAIATHDGSDYQAALKVLGGAVTREIRIVEGTE